MALRARGTVENEARFARLYAHVPQQKLQKLADFRRRYPVQARQLAGETWRYRDIQPQGLASSIPLVLLPGATIIAEVSFPTIEHFAGQHRVITPDYPPVETMAGLTEGLLALLDELGVDRFDLMGGSYGGWMAQSVVRQAPERVNRLVISAVGPPDPQNSRALARLLPWLRLAPTALLKGLLGRSFARLETTQENDDLSLLWALSKEALFYRLEKRDLLALLNRLIDQTDHHTFQPGDLVDWPGQALLLFGAEDPATPAQTRAAMQALYPQAQVKVFEGQHAIALTHQDDYFAAIDAFLSK